MLCEKINQRRRLTRVINLPLMVAIRGRTNTCAETGPRPRLSYVWGRGTEGGGWIWGGATLEPFWTCAPRCVRASGISSVGDPPPGLGPRTVEGLWSTLRVQSHLHADCFFPEPRHPPTHTHAHLGAGWQPRSWASDGQMSELLQVSRTGYKPAEPCGQVMMGSPGDTERQVSEVRGFRAGAGAQVP